MVLFIGIGRHGVLPFSCAAGDVNSLDAKTIIFDIVSKGGGERYNHVPWIDIVVPLFWRKIKHFVRFKTGFREHFFLPRAMCPVAYSVCFLKSCS
jgi:hypothetical protein